MRFMLQWKCVQTVVPQKERLAEHVVTFPTSRQRRPWADDSVKFAVLTTRDTETCRLALQSYRLQISVYKCLFWIKSYMKFVFVTLNSFSVPLKLIKLIHVCRRSDLWGLTPSVSPLTRRTETQQLFSCGFMNWNSLKCKHVLMF